jgi:hypothetical protein
MEIPRANTIKKFERFPNTGGLISVYGLIVMLVYGWSMYQFIWNLPSWISFLTVGEIGVILAYTLATDAFESILVLSIPILFSILLPSKWFRDDFVIRGGLSVLYVLIFIIFVSYNAIPFSQLDKLILRAVVDLAFLHFVIGYVHPLRKFIESLADRSSTFLYLTIPSSIIAGIIILIRSL